MALENGQRMWIAYLGEIRAVTVVEKGVRGMKFKRGAKPKDPYIVHDEIDEEEFVMGSADLHHNPREAHIAAAELAREHGIQLVANAPEEPLEENPVGDGGGADEEEEEDEEEEDEGEYEEDDDEGDGEEWERYEE